MEIRHPLTKEHDTHDTQQAREIEANQQNLPDGAPFAPEETDASGSSCASGWQAAFDPTSQAWYYFNIATGERSWTPPASWIPSHQEKDAAVPSTIATAQTASATPTAGGYFYIDANGATQGPYTEEHLMAWRGMLPMDLPLWYEAHPEKQAKQNGSKEKDEESTELLPDEQNSLHNNQEGASPEAAIATRKATIDLASIIGDSQLLALWRSKHPEARDATCAAPNAAAFQHEIEDPLYAALQPDATNNTYYNNDDAGHELQGERDATTVPHHSNSLHATLAAAALAGLPPDDEAVKLSHAASLVGKSLQEVVAWNHNAGNYTATAMHSAGRGRIVSSDMASESLYASMRSWVDPSSVEEQLQRAKERGKRRLTREEVKIVKAAQLEKKQKKMRAWLQD